MSQYGYNYDSSMSYYPSADYGTGTSGDPQGLGAGSGGVQEHGGHGHGHGHQGHEPHYGSHSQDQSMTASSSTSYGNPYMYSSQVNNQSTQTPSSSSLAGYEHHQQPQQHHHQYYSQQQPTASSSNYHYPSQQQQQQQHVAHSAASSSQPGAMPAPSSSKYSQQTAKSNKSSKHRSSIDQHHLKDVGGGNLGPTAHVKASSTTSEFTKRRNWSQHIIDEVQDFMHVLTPNAVIMFSAPSVQELTGWTVDDVVGKRIYDFIHPDDLPGFKRDFEQSLRDGSNLTLYYRFKMKDDRYTIFETTGHPYYTEEDGVTQCKCFFAVGRPYPSKNTAMLDSFLELKMENERLRQELHIMYREIESGSGPLAGDLGAYGVDLGFDASKGVIDPSTGLVQTNTLMPSSSNTYGALGIGISHAAARGEGSEKKKKKSKADEGEFVCRDCGTVDSPEWRKGPDGPKSLCNACGLRYAKLRSKQEKGGAPAASKAMRSTS